MRKGIASAGNWIIDYVKIIDKLPNKNMLGNIIGKAIGIGGAPHNVLVDIAKLKVEIPLDAIGIIGEDAEGEYILKIAKENGLDTKYLTKTNQADTSYTDVMTEEGTGARTFYHYRGANALLDAQHFDNLNINSKIFHLGYLLLLDKLDAPDEEYGVKAARVLDKLQKQGFKTSVDVVSEQSDRFKRIVSPCLKYTDYLIVNEIEAGETTGHKIRIDNETIDSYNLVAAAKSILKQGVKEVVIIHFPEGGFAMKQSGEKYFVPSFVVDPKEIAGSVGAGDAFCAGALYGLHEEWDMEEILKFANANARFNLTHPTTTGGAQEISEVQTYMNNAKQREIIVNF